MTRPLTNQELTDQVLRLSAQQVQTSDLLHQVNEQLGNLIQVVAELERQVRGEQ